MLNSLINRVKYFGRFKSKVEKDLNTQQRHWLESLRSNGYAIIEDLVSEDEIKKLQVLYNHEIEEKLNFETPCIAQSKIDNIQHKHLIANKFKYTNIALEAEGVTFSKDQVQEYQQAIKTFRPSTLKTYIPNTQDFFNLWLHPKLLEVIESYMGLRPQLIEAYLRRNFPADHKVMNHYWHRDVNNKDYLVKAFIFLSDCELHHGPHEYIAGSVKDARLRGKNYYTDEEIDNVYPPESEARIQSIVKAGTIIIEDTRGLHRARVPEKEFRDLGYAVFMPTRIFHQYKTSFYNIDKEVFDALGDVQKAYIPNEFIQKSVD